MCGIPSLDASGVIIIIIVVDSLCCNYEVLGVGMYYTEPEITPAGLLGEFRFSSSDEAVPCFPARVEVRAVLEGQVMAKRCHALRLGYRIMPQSRILVTGGASQNAHIRQVQGEWQCGCGLVAGVYSVLSHPDFCHRHHVVFMLYA